MTIHDTIGIDNSKELGTSKSVTSLRVTLGELVGELEPVTNWLVLGLHLGVPSGDLRCIKEEHLDCEYSRIKMLGVFMERCDSAKQNWSTVIGALTDMGELQLAKHRKTTPCRRIYAACRNDY